METKKTTLAPLKYKLHSVKEIGFYHTNPVLLHIKNFDRSKVRFTINGGLNWTEGENIFEVALKISFNHPDHRNKSEEIKIFGIDTLISFHISNPEGQIVTKKDKSFDIPTSLLTTFFSIAFSTTRGMLASNTSRTAYADINLPVINPQKVLSDLWGLNNSIKTTISKPNRVK